MFLRFRLNGSGDRDVLAGQSRLLPRKPFSGTVSHLNIPVYCCALGKQPKASIGNTLQ